ncbi:PLDc N-terminal domain-containing protein [Gimesia benthica]|uniref:PLDc N-terminal domain-containing protein n=1 Tax=Gimesia benthica TaxID=2608982 RepID=UPI001D144092|nr:PLDc N-terminal domain-containing protein [Gimesia benthica]
MDWITATISLTGYLITLALIPHILLQKKRHPVSTVSWILSILLLPGLGVSFISSSESTAFNGVPDRKSGPISLWLLNSPRSFKTSCSPTMSTWS